ncbi:MAG: HlyC/CorC family transporter [Parvularculaceae bacterium]|jgi:CBS domain containing-hemolysin-like protein|nr:HlyC/CorC family transporter [Parvularculaceae bacterium]
MAVEDSRTRSDTTYESADEVEDGPSGFIRRLRGFFARGAADAADAATEPTISAEGERKPLRAKRDMIERVLAFYEKSVADVMAPRADIVAVDSTTSLDDLVKAFADGGHSRMPIYRGDLDDPIGMVHLKDVVHLMAHPEEARAIEGPVLKRIKRDILFVPPSMRITDLLLKMQQTRIHMAVVVDEYGGTDGLATIEDLVEEIVGDINDEHDEDDAPTIKPHAGGGWEADARVELTELAEATGFPPIIHDEEVDTLGGLVFSLAGRVPQRGEVLSHDSGFEFEVMEADARKVRKIRIRRRAIAPASAETPV